MEAINLYVINLVFANSFSGVNRYTSNLLEGLKHYSSIRVYQIQLIQSSAVLFYREEKRENYTDIIIPFPQNCDEIIGERYWLDKYNEYVFSLIQHLFENKSNCIIHIHTLNLIALASYIKKKISCKIITHLHCIPWKNLYNKNKKKFNSLYTLFYLKDSETKNPAVFFTHNCEKESYLLPDKIICVTNSGKYFVRKITKIHKKM
jgi:hypothetical protein